MHRKCLSIAISGYSYVTKTSDVFFTKNKNVDRFQLVSWKSSKRHQRWVGTAPRHRFSQLGDDQGYAEGELHPLYLWGFTRRFFNESDVMSCVFWKTKPTCFINQSFINQHVSCHLFSGKQPPPKKNTCFINPPKKKLGGENCKNHGLINLLVLSF